MPISPSRLNSSHRLILIGLVCLFVTVGCNKEDTGIQTSNAPSATLAPEKSKADPTVPPSTDTMSPKSPQPLPPGHPPTTGPIGPMSPGMMSGMMPGMPTPGTGGMYSAIVLQEPRAWFFKVMGPSAEIEKYEKEITAFLKSTSFTDGENSEPKYVPPASWKQAPPRPMRHATFVFGDPKSPLEMSIIPLGIPGDDINKYLLENVNRWRRQVGLLEDIKPDQLDDNLETMQMQNVQAKIVRLSNDTKPE